MLEVSSGSVVVVRHGMLVAEVWDALRAEKLVPRKAQVTSVRETANRYVICWRNVHARGGVSMRTRRLSRQRSSREDGGRGGPVLPVPDVSTVQPHDDES